MTRKPFIVSIAAVSGGGKTAVATALAGRLNRSTVLYFDDYELEGPDDFSDWVKRGADHNEWKLTPLVNDITSMLSDRSRQLDYIVLDYPFAYLNREMRDYIDFAVFIDTPLDIAMARRLLRDCKAPGSAEPIRSELAAYLSGGRAAYMNMLQTVKPNSDIVIDGTLSVEANVDRIFARLGKMNRHRR